MARIVFFTDIEEGHLFPSFGLANSLRKRGHQVLYIGVPDNEKHIRDQGFDFIPVFTNIYPKGFNERRKQLHKEGRPNITRQRLHFDELISEPFGLFLKNMEANLFVMSTFLNIEALIFYYRFGITPVLYTPLLWETDINILSNCVDEVLKMPQENMSKLIGLTDSLGIKASSFAALLQPLNQFCELILCPEEMETGKRKIENNAYYIEPSISGRKGQGDISLLTEAANGKKIIYASMGSQTVAYGEICHLFFDALLQVMRLEEMRDLHLVLSVGKGKEAQELKPLSNNVSIVPWVSQLDILQVSSLAIIHGGLGTVKECIYYGVPMVVIPIVRDQPGNAKRVVHHRLGTTVQPNDISPATLLHAIQHSMNSQNIQDGILRMQAVFQQKEEAELGAIIIENLLRTATQSSKSRVC